MPVFNDASKFHRNFLYLLFTNYDKPVETFFVIGGLLVTTTFMSALDKSDQLIKLSLKELKILFKL